MSFKKLIPWNWFNKEEEDAGKTVPVRRSETPTPDYGLVGPMAWFHNEIDRIFDQAFSGFGLSPFGSGGSLFSRAGDALLKPMLDLGATDKEYTVAMEIPGVDERDVKVEISENILTIRGEKRKEKEEERKDYYRLERSYGSFQRILSLPEDADRERVTATFKKGVLTVSMPRKSLPSADVKRIEVQAA